MPRQMLAWAQHRLGAQALREAGRAKGDFAAGGPIGPDRPPIVAPVEKYLLLFHWLSHDAVDRDRVDRRLKAALAPAHADARVGDAVKYERRRRDPELERLVHPADPFDDEVEVEREVAGPVARVWVAGAN